MRVSAHLVGEEYEAHQLDGSNLDDLPQTRIALLQAQTIFVVVFSNVQTGLFLEEQNERSRQYEHDRPEEYGSWTNIMTSSAIRFFSSRPGLRVSTREGDEAVILRNGAK